jgi:hypothetical protein
LLTTQSSRRSVSPSSKDLRPEEAGAGIASPWLVIQKLGRFAGKIFLNDCQCLDDPRALVADFLAQVRRHFAGALHSGSWWLQASTLEFRQEGAGSNRLAAPQP